jgi:hypothetical protein
MRGPELVVITTCSCGVRSDGGRGARSRVYSDMRRLALVALLCLVAPATRAQQRPLPADQAFLQQVRQHLQPDDVRQSGYMYLETRREQKLDKSGRPTNESVKVLESYPAMPGERRWERLLSEDGRAVAPSELAKLDRDRQRHVEDYARKLEKDGGLDRAKQEEAKDRRERAESIEDVFRVFEVRMVGRESIDGHDTIGFSLTPRPGAKPRTRAGNIMQHFAGHAWFSESDYELVRVDVEAIETVSIGFGLLARVHKGSKALFERRKINGETWLPSLASYSFSARVGLITTMRRAATIEYSNYKKFGVDSTFRVSPGQP